MADCKWCREPIKKPKKRKPKAKPKKFCTLKCAWKFKNRKKQTVKN